MVRALVCSVFVLALVGVGLADNPSAKKADKKADGVAGVVVNVDAKKGTVTVRLKGAEGKDAEKTFTLDKGTDVTDESGKKAALEAIRPGDSVVAVEKEGRLTRLQRGPRTEGRGFDAALFLERFDRNKDGFLDRKELPERFQHAFDQIDTNKDGKLSREELEKGEAFIQRARRPADFLNALLETTAVDDSSAHELQYLYDALRKMDKNTDGKLDPQELQAARERIVLDRVDEIIKDLDADHDGKISRDEARGRVRRDFDKIDLNKDGFIDREELAKAAERAAADRPPPKDKP